MKVWLVWTEGGEYEQSFKSMEGVFTTEALATEFAAEVGGEVEEEELLTAPPEQVTHYEWADHIAPDGTVSPPDERTGTPHWGRRRIAWASWRHQESPDVRTRIGWWAGPNYPDLYAETIGIDKDAVKSAHKQLVSEARARIMSAKSS